RDRVRGPRRPSRLQAARAERGCAPQVARSRRRSRALRRPADRFPERASTGPRGHARRDRPRASIRCDHHVSNGALLVALSVAHSAAPASARDDEGSLDAPAPPTLPALAHKDTEYTFELTLASIAPATLPPDTTVTRALAYIAHNEIEVPIVPRK